MPSGAPGGKRSPTELGMPPGGKPPTTRRSPPAAEKTSPRPQDPTDLRRIIGGGKGETPLLGRRKRSGVRGERGAKKTWEQRVVEKRRKKVSRVNG